MRAIVTTKIVLVDEVGREVSVSSETREGELGGNPKLFRQGCVAPIKWSSSRALDAAMAKYENGGTP